MEQIIKLKEYLDYINVVLSNYSKKDLCIEGIIEKVNEAMKEVMELEKILNYTNASTIPNKEEPKKEMVNHPSHYKNGKIECIEAMLDVFGKGKVSAFCELNAFKYQWRSNNKGTNIQDKEKAIWYLSKYNELNK